MSNTDIENNVYVKIKVEVGWIGKFEMLHRREKDRE